MPRGVPRKAAEGQTQAGKPRQRRAGGGRKPATNEPLVSVSVRLTESQQAWLAVQEGGVSAALRRIVEEAQHAAQTA